MKKKRPRKAPKPRPRRTARGARRLGKAQQGAEMRGALLETALDLFAHMDYDMASMRLLTRKLGVSHNIVHYHFGSKKKLWRAAMEYGLAEANREFVKLYRNSAADAASDPGVVIGAMVTDSFRFPHCAAALKIIARESTRPGPRLDFLYERFVRPVADALAVFLDSKHDRRLRKLDPRIVHLYILGGVPSLHTHWALARKLAGNAAKARALSENYASTVATLLTSGLVRESA